AITRHPPAYFVEMDLFTPHKVSRLILPQTVDGLAGRREFHRPACGSDGVTSAFRQTTENVVAVRIGRRRGGRRSLERELHVAERSAITRHPPAYFVEMDLFTPHKVSR